MVDNKCIGNLTHDLYRYAWILKHAFLCNEQALTSADLEELRRFMSSSATRDDVFTHLYRLHPHSTGSRALWTSLIDDVIDRDCQFNPGLTWKIPLVDWCFQTPPVKEAVRLWLIYGALCFVFPVLRLNWLRENYKQSN